MEEGPHLVYARPCDYAGMAEEVGAAHQEKVRIQESWAAWFRAEEA